MAKAKKSKPESESTPAPTPAKAPKAAGGKKAAPVAPAPAPQTQVPMIDTSLAAATAAKLVVRKDERPAAASPQKESSAFKQMKEGLHKSGGQNTPSFLQQLAPAKKFNNSVPGRNQVGHNQTFGADVNRSGVPRRTGG